MTAGLPVANEEGSHSLLPFSACSWDRPDSGVSITSEGYGSWAGLLTAFYGTHTSFDTVAVKTRSSPSDSSFGKRHCSERLEPPPSPGALDLLHCEIARLKSVEYLFWKTNTGRWYLVTQFSNNF